MYCKTPVILALPLRCTYQNVTYGNCSPLHLFLQAMQTGDSSAEQIITLLSVEECLGEKVTALSGWDSAES